MSRCPACPGKHNCVPSSGPLTCNNYILVGEAPGWEEDKKMEPFVGKTGREVNEGYLPLAGLRRKDIRVTNAIHCLPSGFDHKLKKDRQADMDLLYSCAGHHLYPELDALKPNLIIAVGVFACAAIDPDIDLELQHGIPLQTPRGLCFPMYHPAGGIHEPKKMLHIRTDWARLRKYLRGQLYIAQDEYAGKEDYAVIHDPMEMDEDMAGSWDLPLANDTENTRKGDPYCLTYSIYPGRARMIMADNWGALERYQYHLDKWDAPILWHNWSHDWNITDKMGLSYNPKKIVDTMVRSFQLGNVPNGLKALAFRELGMTMLDFDDLVTPHSSKIVTEYFRHALTHDWPKPAPIQYRDKEGELKTKNPHSMRTKLKGLLTAIGKNDEKDVFQAWKNWKDDHAMIEETAGEFPGKCITHAAETDFERVAWYAMRDADALGRYYPVLRHMERNVRRTVQENWRD